MCVQNQSLSMLMSQVSHYMYSIHNGVLVNDYRLFTKCYTCLWLHIIYSVILIMNTDCSSYFNMVLLLHILNLKAVYYIVYDSRYTAICVPVFDDDSLTF